MKKKNWGMILVGVFLIFISIIAFAIQQLNAQSEESWEAETEYYYYGEEGPQSEFSYRATEQLKAEDIEIPLYLQTDERWSLEEIDYDYGITMEEAGSGFTSMMMLLAYYQETDYDYFEFYDWLYNDYFTSNHDLKWKFFKEVGEEYNLPMHNLGDNFDKAQVILETGAPIIACFQPDTFETNEHFVVLAQASDGTLHVLDPLDSPEKEHYKITYTPEELTNQIQNYWAAE